MAEAGTGPAGLVAVDMAGSIPLILVHPAWQGRGIGTGLLTAALDRLRAGGVNEVTAGSGGDAWSHLSEVRVDPDALVDAPGVRTGADPDRRGPTHAAALTHRQKKETDTMPAIIILALIAIVALTVISFAVHFLLSPWLLVAIAILVWLRFRPRHSHQ